MRRIITSVLVATGALVAGALSYRRSQDRDQDPRAKQRVWIGGETRGRSSKGRDDLTVIDGIGPKIAATLNAAGLHTFRDVASKDPTELEQIVRDAGVRMVGHADRWVEHANELSSSRTAE
jgi:predicted flap endonuclease-1-like 5' DNA nuclease